MFTRIFNKVLHNFFRYIKHFVFSYAHIPPKHVLISCGESPLIETLIAEEIFNYNWRFNWSFHVDTSHSGKVSVVVDRIILKVGVIALARYMGRWNRYYPLDPWRAMIVDTNLDHLQEMLCSLPVHNGEPSEAEKSLIWNHLRQLEHGFCEESPYMDGFSGRTLSDICWKGACQWMIQKNVLNLEDSYKDFPKFERWLRSEFDSFAPISPEKID